MRLRFQAAPIIVLLTAGCGGRSDIAEVDPVQDSLEAMSECLSDAVDCVRALSAPKDSEDDAAGEKMAAPLPAALASVVASARNLVVVSSGRPTEPDAKAILTAAQELENRAKRQTSPGEIKQGLQELRSKAAALRGNR